jgi:hypothetical protein
MGTKLIDRTEIMLGGKAIEVWLVEVDGSMIGIYPSGKTVQRAYARIVGAHAAYKKRYNEKNKKYIEKAMAFERQGMKDGMQNN